MSRENYHFFGDVAGGWGFYNFKGDADYPDERRFLFLLLSNAFRAELVEA